MKWEIPHRSRSCARGQEILAPETPYFSVLTTDEAGRYTRHDYCSTCWEKERQEAPLPPEAAHWKGIIPKKAQKKQDTWEMGERALQLLRECIDQKDLLKRQEAFALGLYLQRMKRAVARQDVVEDNETFMLLEILETGEMLSVPQMILSPSEVDTLQTRILYLLTNDLASDEPAHKPE